MDPIQAQINFFGVGTSYVHRYRRELVAGYLRDYLQLRNQVRENGEAVDNNKKLLELIREQHEQQLEREQEYATKINDFEERLKAEKTKNEILMSMLRMALNFAKSNLHAFYGFVAETSEENGTPMQFKSYAEFKEVMSGFTFDEILRIVDDMNAEAGFIEDGRP